jgi:hypothetical protein
MLFGLRKALTAGGLTPQPEAADPSALGNLETLRDHVSDILLRAGRIAASVREESRVEMPAVTGKLDPEAGPLPLKAFFEHFIVPGPNGSVGHRYFAYRYPEGGDAIDPNAQFHLQQFLGDALSFNLYCQRAHQDGCLGVALQSPSVPEFIDAIIVRSAFFAALIENLITCPQPRDGQFDALRATLDRYMLMASDTMLRPALLETMVPLKGWPVVLVDMPAQAHDGDHFINGVYFTAEQARVLLGADADARQSPRAMPNVA